MWFRSRHSVRLTYLLVASVAVIESCGQPIWHSYILFFFLLLYRLSWADITILHYAKRESLNWHSDTLLARLLNRDVCKPSLPVWVPAPWTIAAAAHIHRRDSCEKICIYRETYNWRQTTGDGFFDSFVMWLHGRRPLYLYSKLGHFFMLQVPYKT